MYTSETLSLVHFCSLEPSFSSWFWLSMTPLSCKLATQLLVYSTQLSTRETGTKSWKSCSGSWGSGLTLRSRGGTLKG
ncbi:Uncharacterized protein HZ326_31324 [Fusarium oxysporum f. sp. albedinis]|nr:Uncharacterized protein HZ326_31324 [Fusarium oxysporum f. sp. albedinis]